MHVKSLQITYSTHADIGINLPKVGEISPTISVKTPTFTTKSRRFLRENSRENVGKTPTMSVKVRLASEKHGHCRTMSMNQDMSLNCHIF